MTKRNSGGKKFRRSKKFVGAFKERELPEKSTGQKYGKLINALGNMQFQCLCDDGIVRRAHVPGSFYRRYFFRKDDHVLVSIRSFEQDKCDLLHKYHDEHVRILTSNGDLDFITASEKQNTPIEEEDLDEISPYAPPEEVAINNTSSAHNQLLDESDSSDDDDDDIVFLDAEPMIKTPMKTPMKTFYESEEFLNL